MRRVALAVVLSLAVVGLSAAATPPSLINYQGVLRDAADRPLSGTYDMVFRFYNASAGGDELLVDSHTAIGGAPVVVSGGLFDVSLGGGMVMDGMGPGIYGSLDQIFRVFDEVWLSIQVGAETLDPRVHIVASPYALNASALEGRSSGSFLDVSSDAQTKVGPLTLSATSPNAPALTSQGTQWGGFLQDIDDSGYAYVGYGDNGILAYGTWLGGYFQDSDSGGAAYCGYGASGIQAFGPYTGGYFFDSDQSGQAFVGYGDRGIEAMGSETGGYFQDSDQSGHAFVGASDTGILAYGNFYGGYFVDTDSSGWAVCGFGDTGVQAAGSTYGSYFYDSNQSGDATLAYGDRGIEAQGNEYGGVFRDRDGSGALYAAGWDAGLEAYGTNYGGYFQDTSGTADAYVASGHVGIEAHGSDTGGAFTGNWGATFANVAPTGYKIYGNGAVSFVQDHPGDKNRVIVYSAPEGDEVAVYTRGTARLVAGEARVALGPTFRWVANPDIGLTAQLTPHGDCNGLYVASLSTDELVVRELNGGASSVVFDYVVHGLRIGFEEASIVQEKVKEAYIPSMAPHRQRYERQPELRAYSALARYEGMLEAAALPAADLTRATALKAAIHEYDPANDPPACRLLGMGPCREERHSPAAAARAQDATSADARSAAVRPIVPPGLAPSTAPSASFVAPRATNPPESTPVHSAPLFPVSGPVERGDLLVLDPLVPGQLRRCEVPTDPLVVGIAVDAATVTDRGVLEAPVAVTGLATVQADAQYGAIRAGDLLVTSATPGHAMKAPELLAAGTVVGKALEPLEAGTGPIQVLVIGR